MVAKVKICTDLSSKKRVWQIRAGTTLAVLCSNYEGHRVGFVFKEGRCVDPTEDSFGFEHYLGTEVHKGAVRVAENPGRSNRAVESQQNIVVSRKEDDTVRRFHIYNFPWHGTHVIGTAAKIRCL